MKKMTDKDWDLIQRVHVWGSYKVVKAAWNIMKKQKYGRYVSFFSFYLLTLRWSA